KGTDHVPENGSHALPHREPVRAQLHGAQGPQCTSVPLCPTAHCSRGSKPSSERSACPWGKGSVQVVPLKRCRYVLAFLERTRTTLGSKATTSTRSVVPSGEASFRHVPFSRAS